MTDQEISDFCNSVKNRKIRHNVWKGSDRYFIPKSFKDEGGGYILMFGCDSIKGEDYKWSVVDGFNDWSFVNEGEIGMIQGVKFKTDDPIKNYSPVKSVIHCSCGVDSIGGGKHSTWCGKQ